MIEEMKKVDWEKEFQEKNVNDVAEIFEEVLRLSGEVCTHKKG